MKDFVKMIFAVIIGTIIMIVAFFMIGGAMIGGIMASGTASAPIPREGVLFVDMSQFSVVEQPGTINPVSLIKGGSGTVSQIGILDAVRAINAAAVDPAVKYIYLKAENASADIATLEELRKSLANFRKSGKAVVAYLGNITTGGYYLASVADKIYMTSHLGSTSMFMGVSSQLIFLKDLLDKVGVNVQLIRHGKYKSAGEMFVKNAPSEENMEQNQVMVNSIWRTFSSEMAESRGIAVETINKAIDNLELNFPEDFLNAGLVDELMTREQLETKIAELAGKENIGDVKLISFPEYVSAKVIPNVKIKDKIAVIFADGEIVDGAGNSEVAGKRYAMEISKVRADSTVKAVVFRVNSPGGSVLASEQIKEEIRLLGECKPVIASYGGYAASGGYWISAGCDRIFADATTLTGSIGVFSMIPDLSGVLKNVAHVNIIPVNSNKHGDMLTGLRAFDGEEVDYMQAGVERIYDSFVNLVAEGRNLSPEFVDSIAQGRVWTGADALEIGLVDEIGTLEDALHYTVGLVSDDGSTDLSRWRVQSYPKPLTAMEQMMEMMGGKSSRANILSDTQFAELGETVLEWIESWKRGSAETVFARMPFEVIFK